MWGQIVEHDLDGVAELGFHIRIMRRCMKHSARQDHRVAKLNRDEDCRTTTTTKLQQGTFPSWRCLLKTARDLPKQIALHVVELEFYQLVFIKLVSDKDEVFKEQ
ncbi:MAG: hypothetical protein DMF69_23980 [Acidobacteria bacterium]|nr:MAG: hypothetical protein DMF69_23980 [Acidobacteriota bacterium]